MLLLAGTGVQSVDAQGVPRWDDRFQGFGVDGAVYAMAQDNQGRMYVAGSFRRAGGLQANNVAMWDGTRWHALGGGLGENSADAVNALYLDANGALYAGGAFEIATQPDGAVIEAFNLARWNGIRWEPLGSGVNDEVFTLAGAENGDLFIGGAFSQDGLSEFDLGKVAVWNGNDLSPVGDGLGTFGSIVVHAFAFDTAGALYAAGESLGGVFKWDGSTWATFGATHNAAIYALAIDSQNRIYAGGSFTQVTQPDATLAPASRMARWDGTGWDVLSGGVNGEVRTLAVDGADKVYAGGLFTRTPGGGVDLNHIGVWDGAWSTLGQGASDDPFDEISAILVDADGDVWVGGDVYTLGGRIANGFGVWRNGAWEAAGGSGLDGEVLALTYDAEGRLFVGGAFLYAGSVTSRGIAQWDGDAWAAVGGGVEGSVYALAVGEDGTLYVGGDFVEVIQPGGEKLSAFHIAAWNGTSWQALGNGFDDIVYALTIDANGDLVAGGAFGYNGPGQMVLNFVGRWDGVDWAAMNVGMDSDVLALAVASDGTLYAGGRFLSADGNTAAAYLARWNGAGWEPVVADALLDGPVRALATDAAGMVYAGGEFTSVTNNFNAGSVVGWDGTQWVFLGGAQSNGVSGCCVSSLAVMGDGALVVGGSFSAVNRAVGPPLEVRGLASYRAGAWTALAEGVDAAPAAMAVDGADLYLGGAFRVAGAFGSSYLGRWSENVSYVGTEGDVPALPDAFTVSAVYPNPFSTSAQLTLAVAQTQQVDVELFDPLGRRVAVVYRGTLAAGAPHRLTLDASTLSSGAYLVRMSGESFATTRTVVVVR